MVNGPPQQGIALRPQNLPPIGEIQFLAGIDCGSRSAYLFDPVAALRYPRGEVI